MTPNIFQINETLKTLWIEGETQAIESGGIFPDEISALIDKTEAQMSDKIEAYVALIRDGRSDLTAIEAEQKRLSILKKHAENYLNRLKSRLAIAVPPEGKKTATYALSWRKSESVNIDESADLQLLFTDHQGLIDCKVEYSANKIAIKQSIKAGNGPMWASIETEQNLQVK